MRNLLKREILLVFHFVYVYDSGMKWQKAVGLLRHCEEGLRKLGAEAFAEGDYASVNRIRDAATAVAQLVGEAPTARISVGPTVSAGAGVSVGSGVGRKGRAAGDGYPKFFRRGEELVKVGWSKKERKEYTHRAPRSAVDATAAAVARVGANGKLFNGDALLPLKDAGGEAVPDYQVYVSLAWLKEMGVVEQRGVRTGYTLADGSPGAAIGAAWAALGEWRG